MSRRLPFLRSITRTAASDDTSAHLKPSGFPTGASKDADNVRDQNTDSEKQNKYARRRWPSDGGSELALHNGPQDWRTTLMLTYLSIGTVFGDLGTSPLYTISVVFTGKVVTTERVEGVASIIFWSFTLVVIVKYCLIVLRADDNGQGGTIALYSLLCRFGDFSLSDRDARDLTMSSFTTRSALQSSTGAGLSDTDDPEKYREREERRRKLIAVALQGFVVFGVSLLLGDGVLTPSISVLSAVEGIAVRAPSFEHAIVPVTCAILLALFVAQSLGTGKISGMFSPIVVIWLLANGAIGAYNISFDPAIFRVLSPSYAFQFFIAEGEEAWKLLGAIMLCITGTEALFADLGHFSRNAIQLAAIFFVYPCLTLTYLGQAAHIIREPDIIDQVYWLSVPGPVFWPMFVLAILATIVASQALISASFSIVKQCMALSCFPKVKIIHTSAKHAGQIYSPDINYLLMIACIIVVIAFGSSTALAGAYGIAVSLDAFMTTLLVTAVMRIVWDVPWIGTLSFFLFFGMIDLSFLSANLLKVPHGGWLPLVMAVAVSLVMGIWRWGKMQATKYRHHFRRTYRDMFRVLAMSTPLDGDGSDDDEVEPDDVSESDEFDETDGKLGKLATNATIDDGLRSEEEEVPMVTANFEVALVELGHPITNGALENSFGPEGALSNDFSKSHVVPAEATNILTSQELRASKVLDQEVHVTASDEDVSPRTDNAAVTSTNGHERQSVAFADTTPSEDLHSISSEKTGETEVAENPLKSASTTDPKPTTGNDATTTGVVHAPLPSVLEPPSSKALEPAAAITIPSIHFVGSPNSPIPLPISAPPPPIGILSNNAETSPPWRASSLIGELGNGLGHGIPTSRTITSDTRRIQIVDPRGPNTPDHRRAEREPKSDDSGMSRFPGVGFFYTESGRGIPGVFAHWVNCVGSIPEVVVFVTLRHTHVPYVLENERWHVQKLFLEGFWKISVTYGYLDIPEDGTTFSAKVVDHITKVERRFAGWATGSGPSDDSDAGRPTEITIADAAKKGVTYFLGKKNLKPKPDSSLFRRTLLQIYKFEVRNSRRSKGELRTPDDRTIEIGLHMSI